MSMALSEASVPGTISSVSFSMIAATDQPLHGDFADIAEKILKHLEQFRVRLINSATIEEFRTFREKHFQSYLDLNLAISKVISASSIDPIEYAHIAQESLAETEKELADQAETYLGESACQELFFCTSTLKSAMRMLPRLQSVAPKDIDEDRKLAGGFFLTNCYVHAHLECLRLAITKNQMLSPDILDELLISIRQAVKVYAFARAGLDLRSYPASRYPKDLEVAWDDEDEKLAQCS